MCNLYSHTKGQQAIREFTRAMKDSTGNLPPQPGIFPDYMAPIVRNTADGRELAMARWGMPSSAKAIFEATQKRGRALDANFILTVVGLKFWTPVRRIAGSR